MKSIIATKDPGPERDAFESQLRHSFDHINEYINHEGSARDRAWKEEMSRIFNSVVGAAFEEAASEAK